MLPTLPPLSEQAAKHASRHLDLPAAHAETKALLAELREADLAGYDHKDASRRELTAHLQPLIEAFLSEETGSYSSGEIEVFEHDLSEFKQIAGKYLRRYKQQVAAGTFDNEMARTVLRMEKQQVLHTLAIDALGHRLTQAEIELEAAQGGTLRAGVSEG